MWRGTTSSKVAILGIDPLLIERTSASKEGGYDEVEERSFDELFSSWHCTCIGIGTLCISWPHQMEMLQDHNNKEEGNQTQR